jgi:menaquinone-dependent protoporphyrinogen oxidase
MKVLVAVASKHGATFGIAQAIGDVLSEQGIEVDVVPIHRVSRIEDYDAVVVGSSVYAGHWLKVAKKFVEANAQALSARPTWLFSSGPIGDLPKPEEDPVDAASMVELTTARDHHVFGGKLDKSQLNFGERALVTALRAPEGDYRDWGEIRAWASGIADALEGGAQILSDRVS